MDKLEKYRKYVQEFLITYGSYKPSYGDVEVEQVFDTVRDHYQIVHVGWENKQRVYGCSIHIDIKDEKIWIQWNSTEMSIEYRASFYGSTEARYCDWVSFSF